MTTGTPATAEAVAAAERVLGGITFPADYRAWLLETNGAETWYGEVFVVLHPLATVLEVTDALEPGERLPGLVAIGSDGASEVLALDLRTSPPPVVLVNSSAAGWHEGLLQAASFTDLLARFEAGEGFRWDVEHR